MSSAIHPADAKLTIRASQATTRKAVDGRRFLSGGCGGQAARASRQARMSHCTAAGLVSGSRWPPGRRWICTVVSTGSPTRSWAARSDPVERPPTSAGRPDERSRRREGCSRTSPAGPPGRRDSCVPHLRGRRRPRPARQGGRRANQPTPRPQWQAPGATCADVGDDGLVP